MESHLKNPHLLRLPGKLASGAFGLSQEWFPKKWQRLSGCGPTTAATLYFYLARKQGLHDGATQEDALRLMSAMWHQITPGPLGLYNPHRFIRGFSNYAARQGQFFTTQAMFCRGRRPKHVHQALDFIHSGLQNDVPVAFLNLHSRYPSISPWHWMPIIGLAPHKGKSQATVLDYGYRRTVPIEDWLSRLPTIGAFIWFR